ncbi:MAG: hypothetical protein LBK41_05270 [Clostridiales bacterium]|nr:hypothetical protein [Clostridiales bacterium]
MKLARKALSLCLTFVLTFSFTVILKTAADEDVADVLASYTASTYNEIGINGTELSTDYMTTNKGNKFKGFGAITCNNSSTLLIDYKYEHPSEYWEIMNLLFNQDTGAGIQHVKIEMGADVNTSSGTEPATMRSSDERANVRRGAGFMFAADAKKVNPDLEVSLLRWANPAWVGDNEPSTETEYANYYKWFHDTAVSFYEDYGCYIDWINPSENERAAETAWIMQFYKRMKEDATFPNGANIKIIAADENTSTSFFDTVAGAGSALTVNDVFTGASSSKNIRDVVSALGYHYTWNMSNSITSLNQTYQKEVWYSEGNAMQTPSRLVYNSTHTNSSNDGAHNITAPGILNNYITGWTLNKRTFYMYQPALGAMAFGSKYQYKQALLATEPWSGYYDADLPIWGMMHWNRFIGYDQKRTDLAGSTGRGWYVSEDGSWSPSSNSGSDYTNIGTTNIAYNHISYISPDKNDFTTVLVNATGSASGTITFQVQNIGNFNKTGGKIYIWKSSNPEKAGIGNGRSASYDSLWFRQTDTIDSNGTGAQTFNLTVASNEIVTVTTRATNPNTGNAINAYERPRVGALAQTTGSAKAVASGNYPLDYGTPEGEEVNTFLYDKNQTNVLYEDDFEYDGYPAYQLKDGGPSWDYVDAKGGQVRYMNAVGGALEVAKGAGKTGNGMRQMIGSDNLPNEWDGGNVFSYSMLGDPRWQNFTAAIDFKLDPASTGGGPSPAVGSSFEGSNGDFVALGVHNTIADLVDVGDPLTTSGYKMNIYSDGSWVFYKGNSGMSGGGNTNTIRAKGTIAGFDKTAWHNMAIKSSESDNGLNKVFTFYCDGTQLGTWTDESNYQYRFGLIVVGTSKRHHVFDNIKVTKVNGKAPYSTLIVDDLDSAPSATGESPINLSYSGTWTASPQASFGGQGNGGGGQAAINRSLTTTSTANASFTFTFTGTGFDIAGDSGTSSNTTSLTVTEGGTTVATISKNAYQSGNMLRMTPFSVRGMTYGTHTVTVAVTGGTLRVDAILPVGAAYSEGYSVTPAQLDFGRVTQGYAAQTAQTLTVANNSATARAITAAIPTEYASLFEVVSGNGANLPASGTQTITVRPKTELSPGLYKAVARVTINGEITDYDLHFEVTDGTSPLQSVNAVTLACYPGGEGLVLPATIQGVDTNGDTVTITDFTINTANAASATAYGSSTLSGSATYGGATVNFSAYLEVVPVGTLVYINSGTVATNTTDAPYSAVKNLVGADNLLNNKSDQAYSAPWGYEEGPTSSGIGVHVPDNAANKWTSFLYGNTNTAGVSFQYVLGTLKPGTYTVAAGLTTHTWSQRTYEVGYVGGDTRTGTATIIPNTNNGNSNTTTVAGSSTATFIGKLNVTTEQQYTLRFTARTQAQAPIVAWIIVSDDDATLTAEPELSANPVSKDWGTLAAGYTNAMAPAQTFTITNSGAGAAEGLTAVVSGDYEITTALSSANIAAEGGTATIAVRPKIGLSPGTCNGTLTVGDLVINLSFKVVAEAVTLDPVSKYWGELAAGYGAQTAQTFTITNNTTAAVTISSVALSGANADAFSLGTAPANVAAGGTATFTVNAATGQGQGAKSATVTVTPSYSNAKTALLSYTVSADVINVSPASVSLSAYTGYAAAPSQTVTVTMESRTAATVTAAKSGADADSFNLSVTNLSVPSGTGGASFAITPVTGLAARTYTAAVTLTSGMVTKEISVTFTVSDDAISVAPAAITLNAVAGYATAPNGSASVSIASGTAGTVTVAKGGTNAASFNLSAASLNIGAGGSQTLTVTPVTGLAAGPYTATITLSKAGAADKTIAVTFTVAAVTIAADPTSIAWDALTGYGSPSQNIKITHNAPGSVNVTAVISDDPSETGDDAAVFSLGAASVSVPTGSGGGTLQVSAKTGQAAGTYKAILTLTPVGGSAITIPITLVVTDEPVIRTEDFGIYNDGSRYWCWSWRNNDVYSTAQKLYVGTYGTTEAQYSGTAKASYYNGETGTRSSSTYGSVSFVQYRIPPEIDRSTIESATIDFTVSDCSNLQGSTTLALYEFSETLNTGIYSATSATTGQNLRSNAPTGTKVVDKSGNNVTAACGTTGNTVTFDITDYVATGNGKDKEIIEFMILANNDNQYFYGPNNSSATSAQKPHFYITYNAAGMSSLSPRTTDYLLAVYDDESPANVLPAVVTADLSYQGVDSVVPATINWPAVNFAANVYETVALEGTVTYDTGTEILTATQKVNAKIEVIKPGTVAFVNAGSASAGSDVYNAVRDKVGADNLINTVSDKAYAASTWGGYRQGSDRANFAMPNGSTLTYTSVAVATRGDNPGVINAGKYDTGFNGGRDVGRNGFEYVIRLTPGEYQFIVGLREWFDGSLGDNNTREIVAAAIVDGNTEYGTVFDITGVGAAGYQIGATPALGWDHGYFAADVVVENEQDVILMLASGTASERAASLAWLQVVYKGSADPGNTNPAEPFYYDTRFNLPSLTAGAALSSASYLTNATANELSLNLMQALYGEGKLVRINRENVVIPAFSTVVGTVGFTLPAELPDDPSVTLYLWDDDYAPAAAAVVFNGAANGGGWPSAMVTDWNNLALSKPVGSILVGNLETPPAAGTGAITIAWASVNPETLLTTGRTIPPASDVTTALVAMITSGANSFTKAFEYTVASASGDAYAVAKTLDAIKLEYDPIPATEVYEDFASDAALQTTSAYGAAISWVSSDETAMTSAGENKVTDTATHPVTMTVTVSKGGVTATKSWSLNVVKSAFTAYLFAYFYGEDDGERMKLGISKDGYQWRDLGLVSSVDADFTPTEGSGHVRDPFIIKGQDPDGNQKYYMLATDLYVGGGSVNDIEGRSSSYQNRAIYTWESDDLINWSVATRKRIADMDEYPFTVGSGNAWAPEAVWVADHTNPEDGSKGAYMMYFTVNRNNQNRAGSYDVGVGNVLAYWFTRDFKTFEGTPQYLYSHSGNLTGSTAPYTNNSQSMDGSVISYVDGTGVTQYLLFYRKDGGGIYRLGPQPSPTSWSGTGTAVIGETTEGPEAFQKIGSTGTSGWLVFADHFGGTTRYAMYEPNNVSTFTTGNNNENSATNIDGFMSGGRARHGGFITIDEARYQALCKAYGLTP